VATSKRAPRKTQKKGPSGRGGKKSQKGVSPLFRLRDGLGEAVTREAAAITLVVVGLFFSAAFASGRGAFLGDAGIFAATHLMGKVGLVLAPLVLLGMALLPLLVEPVLDLPRFTGGPPRPGLVLDPATLQLQAVVVEGEPIERAA